MFFGKSDHLSSLSAAENWVSSFKSNQLYGTRRKKFLRVGHFARPMPSGVPSFPKIIANPTPSNALCIACKLFGFGVR